MIIKRNTKLHKLVAHMNPTIIIFQILCHLSFISVLAQSQQSLSRSLDSLLINYPFSSLDTIKNPDFSNFNGVVLISQGESTLYHKAYGKANLQWEIENTLQTKFLIGSATKPFTSLLVMQLVEKGILSLEDSLRKFIPISLEGSEEITLHHLLTHTSGLPQYGDLMDAEELINGLWRKTFNSEELVEVLSRLINGSSMVNKCGAEFQYNSLNYVLLGLVLEKASGLSFKDLLQNSICIPLRLVNTGYDPNETVLNQFASSYTTHKDSVNNRMIFKNATYRDRTFEYASGGIYSTALDLNRFLIATINGELLSDKNSNLLLQKKSGSYAYGWWINDPRYIRYGKTPNMISHSGAVEGYRANIVWLSDKKLSIIILSNVAPLATRKLTYDIIKVLEEVHFK